MKRITAVHQGYELYGSDRSFVQCLEDLRQIYPNAAIDVLIPKHGDLYDFLVTKGFAVVVEDIWVLRKSLGIKLVARLLALPSRLLAAHRRYKASDVVYINTSVVADYLIIARFHPGKAVAHIREIPTATAKLVVGALVRWSRSFLIFNSKATEEAFLSNAGRESAVVYNGVSGPDNPGTPAATPTSEMNLLILGRINDWKGQDLLVEALSRLPSALSDRVRLKIVGDTFEGGEHASYLKSLIVEKGLDARISFEGFVRNPSDLFEWSHVVVVPSRKPEPFGRVAIEAMAWARPVIAARHGGLVEIVEDGETGLLVEPNSIDELAAAITRVMTEEGLVERLGANGRRDYLHRFTAEAHRKALSEAFQLVPNLEAHHART